MTERTYLDFDVLVEPASATTYRARVLNSPVGETRPVSVTIPFSELELDNFLLRIGRPRRYLVRSENAPEATAVREFGGRLFDAVFHDQLLSALTASRDQAESRDAGLRVRLRLTDSPELADLPWEYLYDRDARRFLALSEWTPLVRYLDLPGRIRPLPVQPPLQVLVLVASPTDFPPLDVDGEWARLHEALGDLQRAGRVRLERAPGGTMAELQRQLRRGQHHVFHYIGHGRYDPELGDGQLAMEGPTGRAQPISGSDLGALLHDHRTLRLGLLNSCEGARGGRTDPYSGTAQSLVYQGIPAVVAMQFEITDRAAVVFTRGFYEAVADGYPLDAAMAEARKAIRLQPNQVEWGTPVLYLRAPDGRIFDVAHPPNSVKGEPTPPAIAPVTPEVAKVSVSGGPSDLVRDAERPPDPASPAVTARAEPDGPPTTDTPGRVGSGPRSSTQQHDRGDATALEHRPGERRRSDDGDSPTAGRPAPDPSREPGRPRKPTAPRSRAKARTPDRADAATTPAAAPRTSTRGRPDTAAPLAPPNAPSVGPLPVAAQLPSPSTPSSPGDARSSTVSRRPPRDTRRPPLVVAVVVLAALISVVFYLGAWLGAPSTPDDPVPSEIPSSGSSEDAVPTTPPVQPAASVPVPSLGPTISVGETPGFVVASPDGDQLYVANRSAGVITVVDAQVDAVTATIPVPVGPPQYLTFSPDGSTAYVSVWDDARTIAAVSVLDTRRNAVTATIPVRTRPFMSAVTPDGTRVYVPNHDTGTISVIDTAANSVLTDIPVPANPHWVEMTPDGSRAYVANHESNVVSVIDTTTNAVSAQVPVEKSPHSVAVHGTRPLVANVNYDAASVTVIDTNTNEVVATVPVGEGPQDITWAADGRFAYVTNVRDNTVSVISAEDFTVTATLPTGTSPTSVAVLPDGTRGYVTNLDDGTLRVLDLDG
jgi:YVTN family beta-propeller protein